MGDGSPPYLLCDNNFGMPVTTLYKELAPKS